MCYACRHDKTSPDGLYCKAIFDPKLLVLQRIKMGSCFAILDFPVELRDVL